MKYHEIVWMLQDTTDRWPTTTLYLACWPMILAILELVGGRIW